MHLKFVQLLNTGIFVKYSASFNEKLLIYECYRKLLCRFDLSVCELKHYRKPDKP